MVVVSFVDDACYFAMAGRTFIVKGRLFHKGIVLHKHFFHLVARESRILRETVASSRDVAGLPEIVPTILARLVARLYSLEVDKAECVHQAIVGQPYGPWGIRLGIVGSLVAQRGFPTTLMLFTKERVLESHLAARHLLFSLGALATWLVIAAVFLVPRPPTGPPLLAS